MTATSFQTFGSVARNTFAATAVTLATISTASADGSNGCLEEFLAEPTKFVAISEGAPGSVTFAYMISDTLHVHFSVPTHSGNSFGEVVGKVDDNGVFKGNGIVVDEFGQGRATTVKMDFEDDGTIVAAFGDSQQNSGFMTRAAFYGY